MGKQGLLNQAKGKRKFLRTAEGKERFLMSGNLTKQGFLRTGVSVGEVLGRQVEKGAISKTGKR